MLDCPACGYLLTQTTFVGVSLCGCTNCGGLWFDNHQLAELTQRDPYHLAELDAQFEDHHVGRLKEHGQRNCPRCAKDLTPFQFKHSPGIVLDGCKECHGIWLGHGALSQIQARLTAGRPAAAPPASPPQTPAPQSQQPQGRHVGQAASMLSKVPCPKCGEENIATDHFCWACGEKLQRPEQVPPCPRCAVPLLSLRRFDRIIRCCGECEGIWLTADDVKAFLVGDAALLDQLDTPAPPQPPSTAHGRARCPDGHGDMQEFQYIALVDDLFNVTTGVPVDRCPVCNGMWFDGGKLRAIGEAITAWRRAR